MIGNEAVFRDGPGAARQLPTPAGLLGMDLLRLALERCSTAHEAVGCIAARCSRRTASGERALSSTPRSVTTTPS
ncbi:MAG: hypothetical protein R2716_08785 [Microthrixaceae bacterium]